MQTNYRILLTAAILLLALVCLCAVATGLAVSRLSSQPAIPPLIFPTRDPSATAAPDQPPAQAAAPTAQGGPAGKIVFVCQLFKLQAKDQLCVINADGSGWRRLTQNDNIRSFYPSFAPDGKSVIFSSNPDGSFKLYEVEMNGVITPVGDTIGYAPEISPDGKQIVFVNNSGSYDNVWTAGRNGDAPRLLAANAWDPTWAPDGSRVLFATKINGRAQLASIKLDGSDFQQITFLPFLRGRSDWSADGLHIVTYSGEAWKRELFLMDADGKNSHQITDGGNSQGPSFSPDGQWVAFTAYFDAMNNENGCEIYIMRIDGSDRRRLTENTYCDWQPRWGP